jgi:nucleoside-diphosphate-sugar epimerase
MTRRSIILIGGEGYIGTVVRNFFLKKKFKVYSIDNVIYKQSLKIDKSNKNFKFIKYDFANKKIFNFLDKLDHENLIVLGSIVGDPITKKYPDITKKINLEATERLLKYALKKGFRKIIFVSTCSNYGIFDKNSLAKENSRLNPKSLYAKTKVKIEKKLMKIVKKGNSEITILRFATAFGLSDRMRFDLTINQFVREIYLNKKIEVYDPYTWRPYCHVKDFANIIFQIVSKENVKRSRCEIFNAGSSKNNFNKMMLINKIKKYIKNFKIVLQNDSADQRDYKVNFSKIKKVYGFKKITSIDEGIKEILKELKKGKFKKLSNYKDRLGNYRIY